MTSPTSSHYFSGPATGNMPYWPYGYLPVGHPMMAAPMAMPVMNQAPVYANSEALSTSSLLSQCPCGTPCSCYGCEAAMDGSRICPIGCISCQNCAESISSAFTVISQDFTFDDTVSTHSLSTSSLTAATSVETMEDVQVPEFSFFGACCLGRCKCPPGTCRCSAECYGSCDPQNEPEPRSMQSRVVFAIDNNERDRDAPRGLSSEGDRSQSGSGVPFERTDTTRSNMSTTSTKTITNAFNRARHQPLRHLKRLLPKPSISPPASAKDSVHNKISFSAMVRGMPFNPHI